MAKTVTFESKAAAHCVVRHPKVEVPSPTGIGYVKAHRGLSYQFQPVPSPMAESGFVGHLTVKVGQDKLVDHPGWLRDGEDEEKTRDAAEALMAHQEFGRDFWIQGFPPGTLLPRAQDIEKEVMRAVATLDEAKLSERLDEERSTHGRVDVLEKIEDALALVREERAAIQAAQAEAEAETPTPKAKAKPKAPPA